MSAVMGFSFPWGCMSEEPQPRRPRIDRSMIGAPTNFVHAGHIGTGDTPQLGQVKDQMSSKGETAAPAESSESSSSVVANALSLEDAQKQFGSKRSEEGAEQESTQETSQQEQAQQQDTEEQQRQPEEQPSQQQQAQPEQEQEQEQGAEEEQEQPPQPAQPEQEQEQEQESS